jgi:hypothetical protein
MTEAEWLASTDPTRMLVFLKDTPGERKLRLFACACCRRIWDLIDEEDCRIAVEMTERFVDGLATRQEFTAANNDSWNTVPAELQLAPSGYTVSQWYAAWATTTASESDPQSTWEWVSWSAWRAAAAVVTRGLDWTDPAWNRLLRASWAGSRQTSAPVEPAAWDACREAAAVDLDEHSFAEWFGWMEERRAQANVLRDIIGNPFRVEKPAESWLTWNNGTVAALAQAIYDDRAFDRLPLLADALEDAGCTNPVFLDHCRQPGEHVRGCWVVDSLLSWHRNVLQQGGHWS